MDNGKSITQSNKLFYNYLRIYNDNFTTVTLILISLRRVDLPVEGEGRFVLQCS